MHRELEEIPTIRARGITHNAVGDGGGLNQREGEEKVKNWVEPKSDSHIHPHPHPQY